jgi:hypothetical protein
MGRPKGSKNKPRGIAQAVTAAASAAPAIEATERKRRGPTLMGASKPRELPYCTGQHCPHCGRTIVPAHTLPYWYSQPQSYTSNGTLYTPPQPPIIAHGNGVTLDSYGAPPAIDVLKHG